MCWDIQGSEIGMGSREMYCWDIQVAPKNSPGDAEEGRLEEEGMRGTTRRRSPFPLGNLVLFRLCSAIDEEYPI
jgi:hypothetical protein